MPTATSTAMMAISRDRFGRGAGFIPDALVSGLTSAWCG
jgi:hypothetical protein